MSIIIQRRTAKDTEEPAVADKSDDIYNDHERRVRPKHRLTLFLLISVIALLVSIFKSLSKSHYPKDLHPSTSSSNTQQSIAKNWSYYDNCTAVLEAASTKKFDRTEWTTKPLWAPSFPSSIEDSVMRQITTSLTGLKSGAKSFYASQRQQQLRQCFDQGRTETVLCLNIHPMIEMRGGPQAKRDLFNNESIILLRNPALAMPAFLNSKRIKYHNLPGQMPLEDWRRVRDETLIQSLWPSWKTQLTSWLNCNEFQVGMYLVYEHLMSPSRGQKILNEMAILLKKFGFPLRISPSNALEMDCLWYEAVGGRQNLESYQNQQGYEYTDYKPGYTLSQRDYLLAQLLTLMSEFTSDQALKSILQEYHDYIEQEIPIDSAWENQTIAQ